MKQTTILLAQRRLTHYRMPLFERIRADLEEAGMVLRLVHGQPAPTETTKDDEGMLPWAERVTNRYWRVGAKNLCWQPLPSNACEADLIILPQENSLLSNYPILLRRKRGEPRVAFFGHGANLQSSRPHGGRERFKRWTTNQVDWWFAYTGLSADLVAGAGFPMDCITNVENAVDTADMRVAIASISPEEQLAQRRRLKLEGCQVGLYLGSLYAGKRLDFLIAAADSLYDGNANFRLLIVGDGPLREEVLNSCETRPWCVSVGAQRGRGKALYLSLADVVLNPGVVGLGILDSFVAGAPLVTTDIHGHGPEIAYLRPAENGVKTADNLDAYVSAVRHLLANEDLRFSLGRQCLAAAERYTIENAANRFVEGILQCLRNPKTQQKANA